MSRRSPQPSPHLLLCLLAAAAACTTIDGSFRSSTLKRAAFELTCEADDLQTQVLVDKTIAMSGQPAPGAQVGVSGCGQRAVYVFTEDCGWVNNSGPRPTPVTAGRTGAVAPDHSDIVHVLESKQAEVKACYESALDPTLAGRISVTFSVDVAGGVAAAAITESTLRNRAVEGCLVRHLRQWRFPAPTDGSPVEMTYPWTFKSRGRALTISRE